MGQYVVVRDESRYYFNLLASDGHILMTSIVFPTEDECLRGIDCVARAAADAEIEDTTISAFARKESPKFRIYEDMGGHYFFRFVTSEAGDIARSHSYELMESLHRRIERVRGEAGSPISSMEI